MTVQELVSAGVFDEGDWSVAPDEVSGRRIVTGVTITPPPYTEFARDGEIVMSIRSDLKGEDPQSIHAEFSEIGVAALLFSFADADSEVRWRAGASRTDSR